MLQDDLALCANITEELPVFAVSVSKYLGMRGLAFISSSGVKHSVWIYGWLWKIQMRLVVVPGVSDSGGG